MKTLFFYGTLRYVPLLERVLGRSANSLGTVEDILPDHAVMSAAETRTSPSTSQALYE